MFRALQIANFTSTLYLDDAESIRDALGSVPGVDADAVAARLDDADVLEEYERHLAEARSAAGTPAEAQDKTATSDGLVRFTAPSIVFRRGDDTAVAGGWQPLLAYDTLLANFAPGLERMPPPESPAPLLEFFPYGLTTAEVALLLAEGSDPVPDVEGTERQLVDLVESGVAERLSLGRDALWRAVSTADVAAATRAAAALFPRSTFVSLRLYVESTHLHRHECTALNPSLQSAGQGNRYGGAHHVGVDLDRGRCQLACLGWLVRVGHEVALQQTSVRCSCKDWRDGASVRWPRRVRPKLGLAPSARPVC